MSTRRWGVIGLDNMDAYYDPGIKKDRVCMAGAATKESEGSFRHVCRDLADAELMERLFAENGFDVIVSLATRAGVRGSIDNPKT